MTTSLRIDEQFTDPSTGTLVRNELGSVIGEAVIIVARGRVFIEVIKRSTGNGVETTITVTFYDSGDKGVRATASGKIDGANLHLRGDFSEDLTHLTVSGTLTVSAD